MKSKIAGFLAGLAVAGLVIACEVRIRPVRADQQVQNSATDPIVSFTPTTLLKFWSVQAGARSVTNDAQWSTAMNTIFSASNWPGVDPTALAFLRSYFVQVVHVGP